MYDLACIPSNSRVVMMVRSVSPKLMVLQRLSSLMEISDQLLSEVKRREDKKDEENTD